MIATVFVFVWFFGIFPSIWPITRLLAKNPTWHEQLSKDRISDTNKDFVFVCGIFWPVVLPTILFYETMDKFKGPTERIIKFAMRKK